METEESYQQMENKIKEFLKNANNKALAAAHKEMKKHVENHFDKLMKALVERKDQLLQVVDHIFKQNEEASNDASFTFNKADNVFKKQDNYLQLNILPASCQSQTEGRGVKINQFRVNLPDDMLVSIQNYGQVIANDNPAVLWRPVSVSTLAGSSEGSRDGVGSKAQFSSPNGMVFNPLDDCLYVCDYNNNMVRKVTQSGEVTNLVTVTGPIAICCYHKENCFYIGGDSHSIRRISISGEIQLFAGTGVSGYKDGPSGGSQFYFPYGIDVDQQTGDVYVADYSNHVIRKISQGKVSTVAGVQGKSGFSDSNNQSSLFHYPWGLCFSQLHHSLFICDTKNNKLRKVSLNNGITTTICEVQSLACVVLCDSKLIMSSSANKIVSLSVTGNIPTVIAGTGNRGSSDGQPHQSSFNNPYALSVNEKTGTLFVADMGNHRIRAIKCV